MDMELMDLIKGGGLVLSGGLVTQLIAFLSNRHNARNQRTTVLPSPMEVREVKDCVLKDECEKKMEAIEKRLDKLDGLEARIQGHILKETDKIFNRVNEYAAQTSTLVGKIDALFEFLKGRKL